MKPSCGEQWSGDKSWMPTGTRCYCLTLSLSVQSNENSDQKWHLHGKAAGLQGEHGTDIELHIPLYEF